MRCFLRLGLLAALTAVSAAAVPTSALAAQPPKPHAIAPTPTIDAVVTPGDACGRAAPDPVPNGEPIVISLPNGPLFTVGKIPATWWRTPPSADAGWQLWLRGFMWLPQLAERAHQDGQSESVATLLNQVVTFHQQNPDPGTSSSTTTANANHWGWDEGTALRRLQAENCLYSLTKDARLVPGMKADVAVQYGPRFYGPPLHPVHNHGMMADLAVLTAARLLARTDWRDKSIARLKVEAPMAFTPSGTSKEQSSSYHALDVSLWFQIANAVAQANPADPAAASIRAIAQRGDRVTAWLTEPDRLLTVYGDAGRDKGTTRTSWTLRTFRDDAAGVIVGRWSWSDPKTPYYVIRYGPAKAMHGHQDRAGITWTDLGQRILVNPGRPIYDVAGSYAAYALGVTGQNVAWPTGRILDTHASVSVATSTTRAPWHQWTTKDSLFGIAHSRYYAIGRDAHQLKVSDTFAGKAAFQQTWHLDPAWTLASSTGKVMVFKAGARALTMTTTGTASAVRGATQPVSGWWFPDAHHSVAAVQINIKGAGNVATTFEVK